MAIFGNTANFNFKLIDFNTSPWQDDEYDNWRSLDALLNTFIQLSNFQGVWMNSTAYTIGQRVVDETDGTTWECNENHTSATSPTTFAADRQANPSYWKAFGASGFNEESRRYARQARVSAGIARSLSFSAINAQAAIEAAQAQTAIDTSQARRYAQNALVASSGIRIAELAAIAAATDAVAAQTGSIAARNAARRLFNHMAGLISTFDTRALAVVEEAQKSSAGITTLTGTSETLALEHAGQIVEMNNAGANTLTVPNNSTVAFPLETIIELVQIGAGATTIAAAGGVTIRSADSVLGLRAQYSGAMLYKRATNEWVLVGDIA